MNTARAGTMFEDHSRGFKIFLIMLAATIGMAHFLRQSVSAQDLVGKAQEEKKLVLYHSTGIEDTQHILNLFRKRHPFLQVENHRLSSQKLFQRIVSEARAGRNLADAYIISGARPGCSRTWAFWRPMLRPSDQEFDLR